jgi:hypothetical protein
MARKTLTHPAVPLVSSLPASPIDGQVVDYLADATNGIIWRFRYRAASASAYKWEFVGGASLHNEVLTASGENVTSTVYAAITTPGPSLTLPLAGDYDIETEFAAYHQSNNGSVLMSYTIGATAAAEIDAVAITVSTALGDLVRACKTRRKLGLSAVTLTAQYRTISGTGVVMGTSNIGGAARVMRATPVRVS